ncbi:MAG TPA: hypothetical protein DD405_07895 [Desulfobacteraceae bacterium]|nr:hypothetical protein [Desulfobacteraceae bacterium]
MIQIQNIRSFKKTGDTYLLGIADIFLVYTMLAPYILKSVVFYTGIESNFFRHFCILSGPGILSLLIYLKLYGIRVIFENKIIFSLFILFSLSFFISVCGHLEVELTISRLKFFVAYCMFGFVLGMFANLSASRIRRLLNILIIFIICSFLYSLYLLYVSWPGMTRFTFPGINSSHMGRVLFFFALVVLFCFSVEKKTAIKTVLFLLLISVVSLGFNTGSITAVISFLFSLLIYLFYYGQITSVRSSFYLIAAFFILMVLMFAVFPKKKIQTRFIIKAKEVRQIFEYCINGNPVAYLKIRRLQLWEQAYERFKQKPMFGAGYKNYYYATSLKAGKRLIKQFENSKNNPVKNKRIKKKIFSLKKKKQRSHPHNVFIELLAETGIMGFIPFVLFFIFVFRKSFKLNKNMDDYDKSLFFFLPLCLVLFFLFSLFHTKLSTEYFKWYFAGMITGFSIITKSNHMVEKLIEKRKSVQSA